MEQNFEYRKDEYNDMYSLYIDGKATEYRIFGMSIPGKQTIWFAKGGEGGKKARRYPSLEAAFWEEAELLADVYQAGSIVVRVAPSGEIYGMKPSVLQEYIINDFVYPLLDSICGALDHHCEKKRRYHIETGYAMPHWFRVTEDAGKNRRCFGIEGSIMGVRFEFSFEDRYYSFSAETSGDTEYIFFLFLNMMDMFQTQEGIEHTDKTQYFCSISEDESPRVTNNNYAAFTDGKSKELHDILDRIAGPSLIYNGLIGKYGFLIYLKDSKQGEMRPEYSAVCRNILEHFEQRYNLSGAMLLCVRKNGKQHIYFYVRGAGLFYNIEDSSLDFLKREYAVLARCLLVVPQECGRKDNK
jgi:hypothetical protein